MQIEYQVDALLLKSSPLPSQTAIFPSHQFEGQCLLEIPIVAPFQPERAPCASPESITASVPSQTELPQQDENPKTRMPHAYECLPFKKVLQKMLQSI